jgi:hypothetical protein
MDHPDPDPAAQAAADVELLLSGASGLQRIVEVARAVDAGDMSAGPAEAPTQAAASASGGQAWPATRGGGDHLPGPLTGRHRRSRRTSRHRSCSR